MQKPEENTVCAVLSTETGSHTELGARYFRYTGCSASPSDPLPSSLALAGQAHIATPDFSPGAGGLNTGLGAGTAGVLSH